ncbi:SEL1-like repeat protein [Pseudoprimorskyibacter insulae]|uniref:SEL1-like repeat protein n=1 Tax=Pseudoprimorskyibacter insulae TaxID=1695997 RepID=UPI0015E85AC0|nr:SEL1-like repeat protein [Pseudoprimorskyibacter insulae]
MAGTSLAAAEGFQAALNAARNGDSARAVVLFHDLARAGSAGAQTNLAVLYAKGQGTPQDDAEAFYWAWRGRLGGEKRAIPVTDYLDRRLTDEARESVVNRLLGDLATEAEKGRVHSFMGIGRVHAQLAEPANKPAAMAWFSVAAAFGVEYSAALRDSMSMELTTEERTAAQADAKARFVEWCGRVPSDVRPVSCPD